MEDSTIDYYWKIAQEADKIDKKLSASYIQELLEILKCQEKDLPPYTKKLFCMKCFSVFHVGENCKVTISSCKKHPNTKFIEYHCLCCRNTQRINVTRSKVEKKPEIKPQFDQLEKRKMQKKRKLMMKLFA